MNDPNGPLWHEGWFHLFYQHNPDSEAWENMHWGHARSRDLVHWEHLPLALRPQADRGEKYCFSGCTALNAEGAPRILYTSVPPGPTQRVTQCIATPLDPELRAWSQEVSTPVLDLATHDGPAFDRDWRDPYVFSAEGRTFLILGATLGDEAVVAIYENPGRDLRRWNYRGILFRAPRSHTHFFECPNLFQLGTKWLLLVSPCRRVEWRSGLLDLTTFTFRTEREGLVDENDAYYATQTFIDPSGRVTLVGWVQRFPQGRGWNGCLGVPRRIWLDDAGTLCAQPVAELAALRSDEQVLAPRKLEIQPHEVSLPSGHSHELELRLAWSPSAAVRCEIAGVKISLSTAGVIFNDRPPVDLSGATATTIHWLLDQSLLEIFVGGRAVFTVVVDHPSSTTAKFSCDGEARLLSGKLWTLQSALIPHAT
ncbi:MAG: hypothetical protein JWM32_155 [Verrucomicrobia bacterium]|nr:hypothetical protein [Verrucomicrobiota bacterium]